MQDPAPDVAKLAQAQGAVGIGPVKTAAEMTAAISKGVSVLKSCGVCVIDFHVDPPADRSEAECGDHKEC
jgi:thiamine pyrophosphate-dependent acetolactate synthase large subunit-like protein